MGTPLTATVLRLPNETFPLFTAIGPIPFKAATAALPGNAAESWLSPVGVGVKKGADDEGAVPVRVRSMLLDMKNHSLSFSIGPPKVPPKRLSTKRVIVDFLQPSGAGANGVTVPAATPSAQNPRSGLFSVLDRESPQFPV